MSLVQMPRKERVEYGGALYHVMGRGNRLEAIFCDDRDREVFLKTLGGASERCGWRVHCYVLMGSHYYLLLETPEAIEEGMLTALRRGWCFGSEEFRAALVEKMGKKDGSVHTNNGIAIKRTHDEQEADRLIAIGLKALGISAVDLPKQPKGSAEKIALASVARQRTSITNAWLAERLSMEAATRVSRYCGEAAGRSDIQKRTPFSGRPAWLSRLKKPDIGILSPQFLAEVRGLKHKTVAGELLGKLLKDERGKCRMTNSKC